MAEHVAESPISTAANPHPALGGDPAALTVSLQLNGRPYQAEVEPWVTLLDLLRERADLTGVKKGCDHGQCGACTVLIDGQRINSCLKLAVSVDGCSVTTIEGLGSEGCLDPLQQAFMDHDAFQCGYCTPGQICSARALITEGHAKTRDEVRELMSGNLCRCGAYSNITDAVVAVLEQEKGRPMIRFDYAKPVDVTEAVRLGGGAATRFLAGGTNLVDLMKENVERPQHVVDIGRLPLGGIEELDDGGLRLGALVTNNQTAYDPRIVERYPLLASAILAGASPQLRNAATNGGNLNQRTRCYYFYDTAADCNKREPGSGCGAIGGVTRVHAILGTSEHCIATHPSDMCVALAALDAKVRISGPRGDRVVPFADYHRLPGDEPWRDNQLEAGDLVTAIDLPPDDFRANYTYLKLRDRLSYAFALVSVAVAMRLDGGVIAEVRIALGGVAHKPWRLPEVEDSLRGQSPSQAAFRAAAERLTAGAVGQGGNDFKIELARRAVTRALKQAADGTPQSQSDKRVA